MGIVVKDLSFKYRNSEDVLKNISFAVEKGSWVSIVGHNGSGKSTLTKILCTLLEHKTGSIIVDDLELSSDNNYEIRKKFGVVFQNPDNQFVGTTVLDDVAFGLQNLGLPKDEIYYRIDKYLEIVNMKEFKFREPHTLSGGQKQRVALAASLALEPEYIILDEATSMLDPIGKSEILELIKYINGLKTTIISITHDLDEALMSDRIIALNKGEIVFDGNRDMLINNYELFNDIGVLVPFSLKLAIDLKSRGVNVDLSILEEELIDNLCQLNL